MAVKASGAIRVHEFNTAWWHALSKKNAKSKVGIIDSDRFFRLAAPKRKKLLSTFAWAEFHTNAPNPRQYERMREAGFFFVDAQLQLRMDLRTHRNTPPVSDGMTLKSAAEESFEVKARDVTVFEQERFFALKGVGEKQVAERYALWARRLIAASPDTCLRLVSDGATQGWFLAEPTKGGLNLTLAMQAKDATVPGMLLYAAAMGVYARQGHALGLSTYSYRHTGVGYLFASLGARVTGVRETWMWSNL
jgi:hypothetical protein